MASDKKDLPKTGLTGENYDPAESARNKPLPGELFVRTSRGSVLLTQTHQMFLRKVRKGD
jgi:hypothetical protein